MTRMRNIFIGLVSVLVLVWIFIFIKGKSNSSSLIIGLIPNSMTTASPTPFPFQEMTIPYLRSRSYESKLGELRQVSQNSDYASYLTNYSSDGLRINGLLTIPTGTRPSGGWPAVVFIHGYIPPQNYQILVNYSSYVDYLARNGFVVFKIDLRGHGDSEGEAGGGDYSGDYIIDTLRALAATPNIPAIVIWAGAVYTYADFSQYSIDDNSYQPPSEDSPQRRKRNELFEKYGRFDSNSEFWQQVPMTNYLDDIKGAIQINHATDDPVVSIDYSRNFNSILDKTPIVHELNEYSSGGHNFTGTAFNLAIQNTVEFFTKYLKEE